MEIEKVSGNEVTQPVGKKIYKTNKLMRDISTVMEHPEFRAFYDKYLTDPLSAQSVIMFLRAYDKIGKKYTDPYEKLEVLDKALNNLEIRHELVQDFLRWRDGPASNSLN